MENIEGRSIITTVKEISKIFSKPAEPFDTNKSLHHVPTLEQPGILQRWLESEHPKPSQPTQELP